MILQQKKKETCLNLFLIFMVLVTFVESKHRVSTFLSLSHLSASTFERKSSFKIDKKLPIFKNPNRYTNQYSFNTIFKKSRKSSKKDKNNPISREQLNSTVSEEVQAKSEAHSISEKVLENRDPEKAKFSVLNNVFSNIKEKSNNSTLKINANMNVFKNPWDKIQLEKQEYNQAFSHTTLNDKDLSITLNEINLKIEKLQDIIKSQDNLIRQLSSSNYERKQKELKEKVAPSKLFKLDFDKIKDTYINPNQVALFSGFTGSIIGSFLARSIARNLGVLGWFICGCISAYFGYIGSKYEAGGVIGNIMAYIGIMLAKKYNETTFLYRSGRLSYVYYQEFEKYDRRYKLMDKWKKFELFTQGKLKEAERFEKRYEIMNRISSLGTGIITLTFDNLQSAFNAKDRKELRTKIKTALPYRVRKHFMTKRQRKIEREKKYRVKFCGQRVWPDFGEEII